MSDDDQAEIKSILVDVSGAYERIQRAGKKWANLDDSTKARVIEATPPALQSVWHNLERVGTGELHPQLVTARGVAARYLSKMDLEDQTKHLTERFELLLDDGDKVMVDIDSMTSDQRKQIFAKNGSKVKVRSLPEQKAFRIDQTEKEKRRQERERYSTISRPGRWDIEKGRVTIDPALNAAGLTLRDVKQLLKDLNS